MILFWLTLILPVFSSITFLQYCVRFVFYSSVIFLIWSYKIPLKIPYRSCLFIGFLLIPLFWIISIALFSHNLQFSSFLTDLSRLLVLYLFSSFIFSASYFLFSKYSLNPFRFNLRLLLSQLVVLLIQILQSLTPLIRLPYAETPSYTRFTSSFSYITEPAIFTSLILIRLYHASFTKDFSFSYFVISYIVSLSISILCFSKASIVIFIVTSLYFFIDYLTKRVSISNIFRISMRSLYLLFSFCIVTTLTISLNLIPSYHYNSIASIVQFSTNNNFYDYLLDPDSYTSELQQSDSYHALANRKNSFTSRFEEIQLCYPNNLSLLIPRFPVGSRNDGGLSTRISISLLDSMCTYGSVSTFLFLFWFSSFISDSLYLPKSLASKLRTLLLLIIFSVISIFLKSEKILFLFMSIYAYDMSIINSKKV